MSARLNEYKAEGIVAPKPFSVGDVPAWVREWAQQLKDEREGAGAPCHLVMYAAHPDYNLRFGLVMAQASTDQKRL